MVEDANVNETVRNEKNESVVARNEKSNDNKEDIGGKEQKEENKEVFEDQLKNIWSKMLML